MNSSKSINFANNNNKSMHNTYTRKKTNKNHNYLNETNVYDLDEKINNNKKNSTKDLIAYSPNKLHSTANNLNINFSNNNNNINQHNNINNHNYTYHNTSYNHNENSILKSGKIFDTTEISFLINNAKNLENVLSDKTPLVKIEEFERKLQFNAKLIEKLQIDSGDILHDKMEMDIMIKEVKGLINQFNDRFNKIDKFLDKGKLKINSDYNKITFDENEYINSLSEKKAQYSSSLRKLNCSINNNKDRQENKLNKTFHQKNFKGNKILEISSEKKNANMRTPIVDKNNDRKKEDIIQNKEFKIDKDNKKKDKDKDNIIPNKDNKISNKENRYEKEVKKNDSEINSESKVYQINNQEEDSAIEDISIGTKCSKKENIIVEIIPKFDSRDKNDLNNIIETVTLEDKKKHFAADPGVFSSNTHNNYIFSREDDEELQNLENEIKRIDSDMLKNKFNKENLIEKENNEINYSNKNNNNKYEIKNQNTLKSNEKNIAKDTLEGSNTKNHFKKIEISKLIKSNQKRDYENNNLSNNTREFSNEIINKKNINSLNDSKELIANSRTMRSILRSTKHDSDLNNNNNTNKNIKNTLNETRNINNSNLTKVQRILYDLENIKNRTINSNTTTFNKTNKTCKTNKKSVLIYNFNNKKNFNNTTDKNSKYYNSNYHSEYDFDEDVNVDEIENDNADEDEENECDSNNKTYYKTNKTFIDLDNSKRINKFFKEEKIVEAIEIWKRYDYKRFDGMSFDRSYEMISQITKIKDKDIEKLKKKLAGFDEIKNESIKKDTEIIELVAEVESYKYKILEMENKFSNFKFFDNKMNELKKQNEKLYKENIHLKLVLDQERYFSNYKYQPNFMKK